MTKNCPNCGKQLPDDAKFCMDCGHSFGGKSDKLSVLGNGKIFIVIIAVVAIVGLIVIGMTGNGSNDNSPNDIYDGEHVDLTINEVGGWDSGGSKNSYTLYTSAIFNSVPDDKKGFNIKTTYYDSNGSEIGHETETLENVYYDTDYPISFGYYTTYKLPDPDHVTVEIVKDGNVIDTFKDNIDKNKIDYLN